jgi:hypothetical protein
MSELQISLIVLGALVILAVVGFNWWQDRRVRRKMQDSMPGVQDDPLLADSQERAEDAPRREPGLGQLGLQAASEPSQADGAHALEQPQPASEPDAMIEAVIELRLAQPLSGEQLLAHLTQGLDLGRRPVRLLLQADDGSLSTQVAAWQQYIGIQIAVLLANRAGAITAIEWSQLWSRAQALAEQLDASLEGPEQQDVLDRADKLDSTCATLDAQVTLTLNLNQSRALADVVGSAKAMGFVDESTHLAWIGDHGLECFTLFRADAQPLDAGINEVERMTLLLDVPRSPTNPVNFGRMLEVGQELARRLGGEVVDEQGRPLASGADVAIDAQLQQLYSQLEAAGLAAGSARARRVFAG